MKSVKKPLIISISLIIVSLIISIGIKLSLKIDKPVFLKSYIDVDYYENNDMYSLSGDSIELKYITNKEYKGQVTSLVFDNTPYLELNVGENSGIGLQAFYSYENNNVESYGPYNIHTVFINLNMSKKNKELEEVIALDKATIFFNDGESMYVDLGKIILTKATEKKSLLDSVGMNASSDGSSQNIFYITDNILVSKIYSPLFAYSRDLFKFNIDKLGYLDDIEVVYNKYEYLYFTSQFYNIEDPSRKLNTYEINPTIYYKDKNGKEYTKQVNNINYKPVFSFKDIYNYLKSQGEI